jgi:hypothetical protein
MRGFLLEWAYKPLVSQFFHFPCIRAHCLLFRAYGFAHTATECDLEIRVFRAHASLYSVHTFPSVPCNYEKSKIHEVGCRAHTKYKNPGSMLVEITGTLGV